MDKYQKFILDQTVCLIVSGEDMVAMAKPKKASDFITPDGGFSLMQEENYRIRTNYLYIGGLSISSIDFDGIQYKPIDSPDRPPLQCKTIVIPIDFDHPAKKMTINFAFDLASPLKLTLSYVEADHGKYDQKVQNELNTKINPSHKTGPNLVNIYWNNASDKVASVRVDVYAVFREAEERLVGNYPMDGSLFKSITGLASGPYCYQITQMDANGNTIAQTPKIAFSVEDAFHGSPRPVNIIK